MYTVGACGYFGNVDLVFLHFCRILLRNDDEIINFTFVHRLHSIIIIFVFSFAISFVLRFFTAVQNSMNNNFFASSTSLDHALNKQIIAFRSIFFFFFLFFAASGYLFSFPKIMRNNAHTQNAILCEMNIKCTNKILK